MLRPPSATDGAEKYGNFSISVLMAVGGALRDLPIEAIKPASQN